jgi:signal transduction histidine kinase
VNTNIKSSLFRSKVARRIFGLFVFCALIPFLTLAAFTYLFVNQQLQNQAYSQLSRVSKAKGLEIYDHLLVLESRVKAICGAVNDGSYSPPESAPEEHFQGLLLNSRPFYSKCVQCRTVLAGRLDSYPNITMQDHFLLKSGNTILKSRADKPFASLYLIRMVDPTHNDSPLLVAQADPVFLWGLGARDTLPPGSHMTVYDEGGILLLSSLENLTPKKVDEAIRRYRLASPISRVFPTPLFDDDLISSFWTIAIDARFNSPKWTVIINQSKDSVFQPIEYFASSFPKLVLLTIWIVILLSILLIKKSLVPIETLKQATGKIGSRQFDMRVQLDSNDEFQDLAQSFNDMSQKLEEGQRLLLQTAKMSAFGQMSAGIVHEIGQPLASITGFVEVLKGTELSSQQEKSVAIIDDELERLGRIVKKFSSFSRPAGQEMTSLSLNGILDQTTRLLEHQLKRKHIELETEYTDIPFISGDKTSLQQVFLNLTLNAVDAFEAQDSSTSPKIIYRTRLIEERDIIVEIEDNGKGIPSEIIGNIFDPFFTTKAEGKGSGLGLAITQSILHQHRATIKVESREGSYTRFILTFPLEEKKALT